MQLHEKLRKLRYSLNISVVDGSQLNSPGDMANVVTCVLNYPDAPEVYRGREHDLNQLCKLAIQDDPFVQIYWLYNGEAWWWADFIWSEGKFNFKSRSASAIPAQVRMATMVVS